MSAFSADWLSLREAADAAARSEALARAIASRLGGRNWNILDLAAGTGSNFRYLATHLPGTQRWLLVDHDSRLLERMPERMAAWAATHGYDITKQSDDWLIRGPRFTCRLATKCHDLRDSSADLYQGRQVVTASALLDLASRSWIEAIARRCAEGAAAVLFALNYDGRIECSPNEAGDASIRDLVSAHQRTDKGFGPAAGPDAAAIAHTCLTQRGYDVRSAPSDWVLGPDEGGLQQALIDGWAKAAAEVDPEQAATIESWRARRLAHVAAGRSRLVVGHVDVAGWPRHA